MMWFSKSVARLRDNTTGAALVEFSLILPVLITLIIGSIEAGLMFQLKNSMTFHTRSITRDMALGNITGAEASTLLAARLHDFADLEYSITVVEPVSLDDTLNDVIITVTLPRSEAQRYAIVGIFVTGDFSTTATMRGLD